MFGFAIGCYLFLAGLAGALGAVAGGVALCVPASAVRCAIGDEYRRLIGGPLLAAALLTAVALLCLLADAARPEAVGALLASPRANILTVGTWLLLGFGAVGGAAAVFWLQGRRVRRNRLVWLVHVVVLLLGLAVVGYSALYLAGLRSVPLWHTVWIVPLFVASSLTAACALFAAMAFGARVDAVFPALVRRLKAAALVFLAVEAVSAAAFVIAALMTPPAGSGAAAVTAVLDLLFGPFAFVWWGGFVAVGLGAGALLDILSRGRRAPDRRMGRSLTGAACLCALVGTFSLRISIIMAGAHPVLGF